jgi:hypothetical protein
MREGCVILASNTPDVDYGLLAETAAAAVRRQLGLPVMLMDSKDIMNSRHVPGQLARTAWHNGGRLDLWTNSPYERTLVLDADVMLQTDALLPHVKSSRSFAILSRARDVITGEPLADQLGRSGIPQLWATVMIFDRSDDSRTMFELAQHAADHYDYYANLYGFDPRPFRNDRALTIACHLAGGHGAEDWSIRDYELSWTGFTDGMRFDDRGLLITRNTGAEIAVQRVTHDVHLLNKPALVEALR